MISLLGTLKARWLVIYLMLLGIILFLHDCRNLKYLDQGENSNDHVLVKEQDEMKINRLAQEKSPYLQQHANNPVDWFPWGEEAFLKAKEEEKPIFLSIGYSTCHWCHVMERESFEDSEIAAIMNKNFINIKVDREERPDIDKVYMNAAQAMGIGGGWPLSIFMTPDRQPFFCGTYFPPQDTYGRPGFISLLDYIAEQWRINNKEIRKIGETVQTALKQNALSHKSDNLTRDVLEKALRSKLASFEPKFGGFSTDNKFPMGHNLSFLLRYYQKYNNSDALHMAVNTLDHMASGGIYDHIGGGFHRYSTDIRWLVPHFEKMLYDQALLIIAYIEAYQITHKQHYARIAEETIGYVLRDLTHPQGGFYAAEDADSDGKEGKFYVWQKDEIVQCLGPDNGELFCQFYGITKNGNFEQNNILTARSSEQEFADSHNMSVATLAQVLTDGREKLLAYRSQRNRPLRDEKIMTDWNGLMISSLAIAARVLNNHEYKTAAIKAAEFILDSLKRNDGRLLKHWREGVSNHLGLLDDYAFFINGLIDLYGVTFNTKWLDQALNLSHDMEKLFWDEKQGGFFLTPRDGEKLIDNPKEIYDGALPSGNSVAVYALVRMAHLMNDARLHRLSEQLFAAFARQIKQFPTAYPMLLIAYDYTLGPNREIVIVGNRNDSLVNIFLSRLSEQFLPGTQVILNGSFESGKKIEDLIPYVKFQKSINDQVTFYICQNYSCQLPTNNVDQALSLMGVSQN